MKLLLNIALALLAGTSSTLMAEQDGLLNTVVDGNGLLPHCKSVLRLQDEPRDNSQLPLLIGATHCIGYVDGVLDTLELWGEMDARVSIPRQSRGL